MIFDVSPRLKKTLLRRVLLKIVLQLAELSLSNPNIVNGHMILPMNKVARGVDRIHLMTHMEAPLPKRYSTSSSS